MWKRWLALSLALVMMFMLPGCGGAGGDEPAEPTEAPESEQAEQTEAPEQVSQWRPDGGVKLLVADEAGSLNDITARVLAQYLERYVGQTVSVEDVPGAYTETNEAGEITLQAGAGTLGWRELAAREPDGLTLGYIALPDYFNALFQWPDIVPSGFYTPVCTHTTQTAVLIARADDERFDSLQSMIVYGKEHDPLVAATDGERGLLHTWTQLFAKDAELVYNVNHQPTVNDAVQCLLDGAADFAVVRTDDIMEREEGLRVLGVFGTERLAQYPDAPTLGELGYYPYWLGCAFCVVAPNGVDHDALAFYEDAFRQAMEDTRYLAASSGVTTDYKSAAETEELMRLQRRIALRVSNSLWW